MGGRFKGTVRVSVAPGSPWRLKAGGWKREQGLWRPSARTRAYAPETPGPHSLEPADGDKVSYSRLSERRSGSKRRGGCDNGGLESTGTAGSVSPGGRGWGEEIPALKFCPSQNPSAIAAWADNAALTGYAACAILTVMSCRNHSIKVSDATWSFWQGVARSKGLSVTKAIGEAMRLFGSDSSFAPVSLKDAVAEVKAQACGRSKPMPEAVFIVKDSNVHAVPKPPADPLPAQRSKLDEMRERQAKAFLKKGGK